MQELFEIENGVMKAYTGPDPEVTVPEGVHTIGDGVFKGMAWLLKVTLPSSVKKIGDGAFKGCRQLKSINFPDGLQEIGEYAFHRCHGIDEMTFPKSVTNVGPYAFLYCDSLKKAVLEGHEHLGKATFSHNLSLHEISLNKNLDTSNFSDEVFEGCVRLQKIMLSGETYEVNDLVEAMSSHSAYPETIRAIAKSVFHSLQIEDGVLCSFNINLKSISLPEGITAIGKSCFFDKKGIVDITFPKSLREIRANAFLNCVSLEEVNIQSGDIILDDKAFRGCCNLKRVNITGDAVWDKEKPTTFLQRIRDQILGDFYISGNILVRYMGEEEQIVIPDEVKIIGERCFFGNERLKVVTCPDDLVEIREQAFMGCVTLQNVNLSDKLKRVEREAFAECKKLLKCSLPASVEYIGEYAFRRCLTLPVFDPWPVNAAVSPYAFYKAKNFLKIGKEPYKTDKHDTDASDSAAVTVNVDPERYIEDYAHAKDAKIKLLNLKDIDRIGRFAYANCPNLEEVFIDSPGCVIERGAFSDCKKLKRVSLHVKEAEEGVFSYCRNLEEAEVSGLSALPEMFFAGCYKLRKFDGKHITQIGARCFDECVNLDHFDLTDIKTIGERAFERCDSLTGITLSNVKCGYHAFADCASLKAVEISEGTVLRSGVFFGSTGIDTVTYDGKTYKASRFSDSLNHVGNPYPLPVREVLASTWSCFEIYDRTCLTGYNGDATGVTVPQDIEEIGQDVFRDHARLKKIDIPKSVKLFGSHAFSQTAWLEEQQKNSAFVIINNVLIDGAGCKGKVVLPEDVKRVAGWAFAGNIDITELVIPSERISIESLSFRNCLNLKKITDWNGTEYTLSAVSDLKTKGYPELIQRIFSECINCFKLDENRNLVESTGNITRLIFPEGILSVGDGVYKDCHLLETIALSGDTKSIGKSAFESSKWLKTVSNAGAVKSIGALAFSGCQSLESIDVSENLEELGKRCFEHCVELKEINLTGDIKVIPERAFFRCKSLKKICIPASVKVIEAEAFAFCEGLEEAKIPEGAAVSAEAFAFCDSLTITRY